MLSRIFSTIDLPVEHRVDAWMDLIGRQVSRIHVEPRDRDFDAAVELYEAGPVGAQFLTLPGQTVRRIDELSSHSDPARIFVQQVRDAPMRFRQAGREFEVRPGECALIDGRYPHEMEYAGRTEALGLSLAPDRMRAWSPQGAPLGPAVLRPGEGWGGVVADVLSRCDRSSIGDVLAGQDADLMDYLGPLLALATNGAAQKQAASGRRDLLARARDLIRARFYESDLTPGAVAASLGISVRQIHMLFASEGSSFGRELREGRLAAARRLLGTAGFDGIPVGEVAVRCGFRDSSHFARVYLRRYGTTPSQARRNR